MNRIATVTITATFAALAVGGIQASAQASDDASTTPPPTAASTQIETDAINYVSGDMGATDLDGYCLEFVEDAYSSAGLDVRSMASDNSTALAYWNSTTLTKHPASEEAPAGALVFWDANAYTSAGHVAMSYGGDEAGSTEERDNTGVHVFSISARNSQGYAELGWVMPDQG